MVNGLSVGWLFISADEEALKHFYIIIAGTDMKQVAPCLFKRLRAVSGYVKKLLLILLPHERAATIHPLRFPRFCILYLDQPRIGQFHIHPVIYLDPYHVML